MSEYFFDQHENYMSVALSEAEKASDNDEVPVGAVIVYDGKIIAKGHNQREMLTDPTAHAEMIAITQAANYLGNWRLNNSSIYVTLEPCLMCIGAILEARISTLVFGTRDNKKVESGTPLDFIRKCGMNRRLNIVENILEIESKSILQSFFQSKRIETNRNIN